jgi:hypothetical protein
VLEVVGQALGTYGNEVVAKVETMIAQAVDQVRTELRAELANQLDRLRSQIDSVHTQGNELRAQLEEIIAKKKRARPKALLQLPAPNGDARPQ